MDTQNQFWTFLLCVAIGFCGGILYEVFAFFRLGFCRNNRLAKLSAIFDVAFWLSFAVFSTCMACLFDFSNFRTFWWIGHLVGGIIYLKTLHKIIAFFENVCYNKLTQLVKKARKQEKTLKKRRVKKYDAR
jgi:hypothetical protein